MQAHWRRGRDEPEQRATDDVVVEAVVLAYILAERPEGMTIAGLALRFNAEFDQGINGTAVERAIRELVCDGRLRVQAGLVVPNQAAWGAAA